MGQSFYGIARLEPDRTAVVDPSGSEITFGELADVVNQTSATLSHLGLERGDVVSCVLRNGTEFMALYLAATQIGLYFTPINWHWTGPEIRHVLEDGCAKVLVTAVEFYDQVQTAAENLDTLVLTSVPTPGSPSLAELRSECPTTPPPERSPGRPMLYTSGTTGVPKAVKKALPTGDVEAEVAARSGFGELFGIEGPGIHLVTAPMYHAANIGFGAGAIHQGRTVVMMDGWSAEGMLGLVKRYRVESTHMVPTMFHRLLRLPEEQRRSADHTSLKTVVHAAAPCPVETKRQMMEWWGPVLYEYYAATEGGGTWVGPEDWLARPGTVGRPWPGAEIRIVGEDGEILPAGQPGLVYMKLGSDGFAYHRDRAKTDNRVRDGFVTAGDIGYLDDEGWLFLCDREADTIVSGGVNIYPAEIESALLAHRDVVDAAVIGVPDEEWGERVHAVVVLSDDHQMDAPTEELRVHCGSRIARYKVPRTIEYRDALPRDPSGKLLRRVLRDPHWVGRSRAI